MPTRPARTCHVGQLYRAGDAQLPPRHAPHNPWRTSLICTGRGFGKTRAGAEWVCGVARAKPATQVALVGANLAKVRNVMAKPEAACGPQHSYAPGSGPERIESLARIDLLLHPEVGAERGDPLADPEVDASYLVAPQALGIHRENGWIAG